MSKEIQKILEDHEKRILTLEEILKKKPRKILRERKSTLDFIIELKSEGFFREGKTISQIRDALHTRARIVKLTDLPAYLLRLVRNGALKRKQELVGKKKTWVYFA